MAIIYNFNYIFRYLPTPTLPTINRVSAYNVIEIITATFNSISLNNNIMFYQLKDTLNRYRFSRACKQIFKTPPVLADTDQPVAVLTQLQHKDVILFLVAVKTFARQVPLSKVFIINDGSLTNDDLETLLKHIPIADIYDAKQFSDPLCPTGACWERLLAIAHFIDQFFIIQLDSDTLTLSAVNEIIENIKSNTGFVIGTWDNQKIEPMIVSSERVQKNINPSLDAHVQMVAEAHFSKLEGCENLRYARGCAGFSGFPKQSFNKQFIIDFSIKMEKEIGSKWREWGSEQVMSNVVVANIDKSMVLPHPKYTDCKKMKLPDTCFIHFIGECRFSSSIYAKLAQNEIKQLTS